MFNEYENILLENNDEETGSLFKTNIFEIGPGFFNFNRINSDFDINLDEFKNQSETKSHSATPDYLYEDKKEKVFQIVKTQMKEAVDITLSQRMKMKKEKAKFLLGEKKRRISYDDNGENTHDLNESFEIPNKEKLTKKEIKMIRNRISAQKSRDKQKHEFNDLKLKSDILFHENSHLKKKLQDKDNELCVLKDKMKNCPECCISKLLIESSPGKNTLRESRSFNLSDSTSYLRNNLSGKTKVGLFSGFFLFAFVIGCIIINPWDSSNENNAPRLRNLIEVPELTYNSKQSKNTSLAIYPNADVENTLPILMTDSRKLPYDEMFLDQKRLEFILNLKKGIQENKSNFLTNYVNNFCYDYTKINTGIKDERKSENSLTTLDYYKSIQDKQNMLNDNQIDYFKKLNKQVESLYCKDYIFSNGIKLPDFDNILINDDNNNCHYLHLIIPAYSNKLNHTEKKEFYEIGCKIFEINKIYK